MVVATVADITASVATSPLGDSLIYSELRLDVSETIKGSPQPTLIVTIVGGEAAGTGMHASNRPVMRQGDRAIYFLNPASDGSGQDRKLLRQAAKLLKGADWSIKGGKLINDKTGEAMVVEFLLDSPTFERGVLPLAANLQRLGIKSDIRVVDDTQYVRRVQSFDFDIIVATYPQSESPGNEQRDFWGSAAADRPGSRNVAGVKDPVLDELVEGVIAAADRQGLVTATHALDRVLLWKFLAIPNWHIASDRVAYWDMFGQPKVTNRAGVEKYRGLPLLRFVNDKDPVPLLPPLDISTILDEGPYKHVGPEVVLKDGTDYAYFDGPPAERFSVISFWNTLGTQQVPDHSIANYLQSLQAKTGVR